MLRTEAEALRDQAAAKTRQRIARHRQGATSLVAPLLDYIAEHLFEPGTSYGRMRKACRIRDNNRSAVFRREVGLTPAAYLRDCRFEVACELLRGTDLEITVIGDLVGYHGSNVFGAAFRGWAGLTPARYRRQQRQAREASERLGLPADHPDLSPAAWRRFVEGELPDGEANRLLRYLLERYPSSRRDLVRQLLATIQGEAASRDRQPKDALVPSLRSLFARQDIERLMAEIVWEDLRELPAAEMSARVRHRLHFTTPALVELLGEKAREKGRGDRSRGVAIARVALEAASAFEGVGGDEGRTPWTALAWAWLGNAQRLALDFTSADRSFVVARRLVPDDDADTKAEVLLHLASLRLWQRRFDEAREQLDAVISRPLGGGQGRLMAMALIQRGVLRRASDQLAAAADDHSKARTLLDPESEPRLYFAACYNLATCLVEMRDHGAAEAVRTVRALLLPQSEIHLIARVRWLEGQLAGVERRWEEARERLIEAREILEELDCPADVAVLDLDLAWFMLQSGDRSSAREHAEKALILFEELAHHDRALVAQILSHEARDLASRLADDLATGLSRHSLQTLRRHAVRVIVGSR